MNKPKVIAVVGPTASGKTTLSIELAKTFNGEVISADSRQVYRGLDIGTGKVTEAEMDSIPHHLLDVADPMDTYTAANFKYDATAVISRIQNRGHIPIVAGGTFFYLDVLREKLQSAPVPPNEAFRKSLEKFSNTELYHQLQTADSERALTIDSNNRRRLVRALEIVDALGAVPPHTQKESPYDWLIIGIDIPKKTLRANFARRLNGWLTAGFQAEVEELLAEGVTKERFREIGFEYTLMLEFMDGEISLAEFKEKFIQKNWQYAKRQLTWLKKDSEIVWFSPANKESIFQCVDTFLHQPNS